MKRDIKSKTKFFRANFYAGNDRENGHVVGSKLIAAENIERAIFQEIYYVNGHMIQSQVKVLFREIINENIHYVTYNYPESKLYNVIFHTDFFEEISQP